MACETNHCDVIDCPECRAEDVANDRERAWERAEAAFLESFSSRHELQHVGLDVEYRDVWESLASLELTIDVFCATPDNLRAEFVRRLRDLADAMESQPATLARAS